MNRWTTRAVALALALNLAACWGDDPEQQPAASTDTTSAVGADTAPVQRDSLPADPVAAPGLASRVDTAAGQTTMPSAPEPLAVAVDSMRAELARLSAAVTALQPPATGVPLPAQAAADTGDGSTEARVRETAQNVRNFGLRAVWAIILLAATWLVVRASAWLLEVLAERSAARRLLFKKLIPIVRLLIWGVAAYVVIIGVFDIDRAGLLAATAALGVGIGFAAQGVLKNIFGGLIIIFDQPFQVGDKIKVGGTYGEVVAIGMRSTRIVTPDDNLVSVPNAQVVEDQVANANAGALDCQVVVDLYLPGWVDVMKAKSIAYGAAANSKYVYLEKPIVVNVKDEFKETFLTHLVVKAYVLDTRYEFAFASDVTESAKTEFLKHDMLTPMVGRHVFEARERRTEPVADWQGGAG